MITLPLNIDFSGKVVVVTGAGGLICGAMARAFAQSGAKVAALDLNEEAVKKLADELKAEGFVCEGYKANVLDPAALEEVHKAVLADLGSCDILINGAGGNNPRATTDNEYQHEAKEGGKSFFDLEANGVDFVFKLNFQGTLLPTQAFAKDMVEKKSGCKKLEYAKGRKKPDSMPARTKADDYIGKKNNKLTVIGLCRPGDKGRTKLECLCECGNITYVYPYQFNSGDVKSCGCLSFGHTGIFSKTVGRKTHGLSQHPFYKTWNDMIRRCHYPNEPAYKFYGAKGIQVCEEWRHAPDKFIKWCEETHPEGDKLTIDRIDGSKGYSPENCRWIPQSEQPRNIKTNRKITLFGETKCITTWCNELNISSGSVYYKVKKGMSFEEAILDCVSKRKK